MIKIDDLYKEKEEIKEIEEFRASLPNKIKELYSQIDSINIRIKKLKEKYYLNAEKVKYKNEDIFFENIDNILNDIKNKRKMFFYRKIYEEMINYLKEIQEKNFKLSQINKEILDLEIELKKEKIDDNKIVIEDNVLCVSENEEKDLRKTTIDKIPEDEIYLVHCTDYFPRNKMILNNYDGKKEYGFKYKITDDCYVIKNYISNRQTVHFTANCKVENTADGRGIWNRPSFIIIDPYKYHKKELVNKITNGDNYAEQSIELSDEAILMVREDCFTKLSKKDLKNYKVIKYKGDATECLENLFYNMKIPVIDNNPGDAGHSKSEQYFLENVLNTRNVWINILQDVLPEIVPVFLNEEEVAVLYDNVDCEGLSKLIKPEEINKIASRYGVSKELASFILCNGIVKLANGKYSVLDYAQTKEHLNDSDYYISRIDSTGLGLGSLQVLAENYSTENYCIKNQNPNNFDNITIGNLQVLKNFNLIKQFKEKLNMNKNMALLLRQDGLYTRPKSKDENDYLEKGDFDIKIGDNIFTLNEAIENYKKISEDLSQYFDELIENDISEEKQR